jgi:hypothetical protein
MSLRTALMAAIVLDVGGIGLVAWIGLQLPAKPSTVADVAPHAPAKTQILAAAHPLRAGSLLKFGDVQPHEMLASEVPEGAHADTPQARTELVGSMARRSLQPQDILLPADLLRPGDHGFLAAVLRPGVASPVGGCARPVPRVPRATPEDKPWVNHVGQPDLGAAGDNGGGVRHLRPGDGTDHHRFHGIRLPGLDI